ncbi:hypothetical protein CISIN_1g015496mg [Citrus sinensis]|uniref:Nucleotide exchange factor Fes1 domain-containing protein n=1 Tax=Citrus sinensis TaxID=2711 RepID=A0A067D8R3_CITSI|nr:hypothetical protein CISIN_1g015496mg [Citrus sinensis]
MNTRRNRIASRALWLLVLLMITMAIGRAERVNNSSSAGLFWSTAKEDEDQPRKAERNDDSTAAAIVNDHDELDGGFSSIDGMLQWAIAKLKETAQDVQRLSPSELKKRQMEIKELMEKLKTPSDAQLIQIAIDDLNNSTLSLEDSQRALQELLILVEPIDNANDLSKLGGLSVLVGQLNHPDTDIRKISAWILGKASQNNPLVQKQVLELGALSKLMKMVKSSFVEEAVKALYTVSSLIRNNLAGQEMFYVEAGDLMLQDILGNSSFEIRLHRKAVSLVGDLAKCQLENMHKVEPPLFRDRFFLKSVVDLTASADLDLQEKALAAIKNLLQLRTTEALVLKDFCGLDTALERLRQQLQEVMLEEDQRDYAMDVEALRREVELIFFRKLDDSGSNMIR